MNNSGGTLHPMTNGKIPAPTAALPSWLFAMLLVAWIVPGLVGHEPWKPDEAYTFGLIHHIVTSGDWVVPTLAGQPFMEKPPLYFLTAAMFVKTFTPWLSAPDAARLTSGFFAALTILFTMLSARELFGAGRGRYAALALIACFGLLTPFHQMLTDVIMVAGIAAALYGFALGLRRPLLGGLFIGMGVGIGFMAKGLLAPGTIGLTALVLPIVARQWRTKRYLMVLACALVVALPWLTIWPLALWQRSPELFNQWLITNNFGRFLGYAHLGPGSKPWDYFLELPWFAWPALPFALLGIWPERGGARRNPGIVLPATLALVTLVVLMLASDARDIYALPLLVPLAVLASLAPGRLSPAIERIFYWAAGVLFAVLAVLLWSAWSALHFGIPTSLAAWMDHRLPGYVAQINVLTLAVGVALVVLWIALMRYRGPESALLAWAAGAAMIWGLAMTQLESWLDVGDSYRDMMLAVKQVMPPHYNCVANKNLGEPQRAMLEYYANIDTQRVGHNDVTHCDVMLTQFSYDVVSLPGWRVLWHGHRSGDHSEHYTLLQKITPQHSPSPADR